MKYTWEAEDIKAGLYIVRCDSPSDSKNLGFKLTCSYIISWNLVFDSKTQYTLTSLADGWSHGDVALLKENIKQGYSKETLAKSLNEDERGYRLLTKSEMHKLVDYATKNFEL